MILHTCNTTTDLQRRAAMLRECDIEHVQEVKRRLHNGGYPVDEAIDKALESPVLVAELLGIESEATNE